MRIIPVIDIQAGQVVRAAGGRRDAYRRLVSRLTASAEPAAVAEALLAAAGADTLYVADLDAITGTAPPSPRLAELACLGAALWVDAGVREAGDALRLAEEGIGAVVVGLETVSGPAALAETVWRLGPGRVVFSLDLQGGKLLGRPERWGVGSRDATGLAREAFAAGVRRMIVLDLGRVGLGAGTGTEALLARLAAEDPAAELIAGGGVRRDRHDLDRLARCGARAALVASALHDGRLP